MIEWFDVRTIAFRALGYEMSWIELLGTVFYLGSVALIARRNMLTWPVGIVGVLLYAALFWQIRLYSDAIEQVYYLGASAYGWWNWTRASGARERGVPVGYSGRGRLAVTAGLTLVACVVAGAAMTRIHLVLPSVFPAPADFPWLDAGTTVASFVAMALMARRRVESWIYWIVIDVVGIGLYHAKGVLFVSLLYVILLAMAVLGLAAWHRGRRAEAPGA